MARNLNPFFNCRPDPEVIKLFFLLNSIEHKIYLINVIMPTIVGILPFISIINTPPERFKARYFLICRYFSFYERLSCSVELCMKNVYNLRAWCYHILHNSCLWPVDYRDVYALHPNKQYVSRIGTFTVLKQY